MPEPEPDLEPDLDEPSPTVSADVKLETVVARWDAVVELVRQASPRAKAIFEPAVPIRLDAGILTLHYGQRYASFHADQAARDDMGALLREALVRACSLDARIQIVRDGEDQRARPTPPLVSDLEGPSAAAIAEEARDVAEADAAPAAPVNAQDIGRLLADRLDATLEL
jgi:hypothetical protein